MKLLRHNFCDAASLHCFFIEAMAERAEAKEKGKDFPPIVIELSEMTYNPHDILGAYDILSFHASNPEIDLNVTVRVTGLIGLADLAILAAVPEEFRFISRNSNVITQLPKQFGWGTYTDLKIAAEATEELYVRIFAAIAGPFGYTVEELREGCKTLGMISADEIISRGACGWGIDNKLVGPGQPRATFGATEGI